MSASTSQGNNNNDNKKNTRRNAALLFRQYLTVNTNATAVSSSDLEQQQLNDDNSQQITIKNENPSRSESNRMYDDNNDDIPKMEEVVTHIYGHVSLSPSISMDGGNHDYDQEMLPLKEENNLQEVNEEDDNVDSLQQDDISVVNIKREGVSTPESFDEDLGSSIVVHNVPLVAIHRMEPQQQTTPPRKHDKSLLRKATLWSSVHSKNQQENAILHIENTPTKYKSSAPSSSCRKIVHRSSPKPLSEHLIKPTEADKSRSWNHPRNQLNRKDSITSISNIHGRRSSSNIGGRDISPVSIDNELGGKLDQEEAVNVSSFSNVHSESSPQQQQLSSTVKKIRRKTQHMEEELNSKKELYDRLSTPTKAFEHSKYKPVDDESRIGNQWKFKKALQQSYQTNSPTLLKPTVANIQGRW